MKKRRYRATDVKRVNVEKLAEKVRDQRLVFGVDVAKEVLYGSFLNEEREPLLVVKWHQLRESSVLLDLLSGLPSKSVEVAMEPSGTYGDPLRAQLRQRGIDVYRVSPKRCYDYSEVYDGVPSQHDGKSAVLVGRLHCDGLSERWEESSESERELSAGVSELEMHADQYHRQLNRLEAQLGRHWPELTQCLSLDSATLVGLLVRYGDPRAVVEAGVEAGAEMRRLGRWFLKPEKIQSVLGSAASTIGVPMSAGERHLMQELAGEAQRSRHRVREVEKRLRKHVQGNPAVSALADLLGLRTGAVMVVKGGDPLRTANPPSYVKNLGLNLKERSSGKYQGQLRITKRGSGTARQWLYLATLRLIQRDAVVRGWYKKKVARDGGKTKKRAVVAVMRKLAAAMWYVARGGAFDATELFDVNRLQLEPAAS